jgi:1,6-anhydro-N-acetylmuramate kinase
MPSFPSAHGIPTLTQHAEPDIPVLDTPVLPIPAGGGVPEAVLRAALQAEIEQAVQAAVNDAAALLRQRLEAELPALLAQALARVRPG